jgi:hypothetical protein
MSKIFTTHIVKQSPWLKGLSPQDAFQVKGMLSQLEDSLVMAALSLTLFEHTKEKDSFVESLPGQYQSKLSFLYAHEFLYALDTIDKIMATLENIDKMPNIPTLARDNITRARLDFNNKLPGVNPVRNSAHHVEDRVRGKKTREQDIVLQPVQTPEIAAVGGALVISNLSNNRLSYTGADGTLKEVEVSEVSLEIAQEAVQKIIDSFEWETTGRSTGL